MAQSPDSSTLTFFFTVVVAFVVIRWFIIAENVSGDTPPPASGADSRPRTAASSSSTGSESASSENAEPARRRNLRRVTAEEASGNSSSSSAPSSSSSSAPSSSGTGYTPADSTEHRNRRPVTESMIEVVAAMAPNLAREQIEYDLQQTGNIESTIEKYLATGTLPFPPNYNVTSSSSLLNSKGKGKSTGKTLEIDDEQLEKELAEHKMKWSTDKEERQKILNKQRELMMAKARRDFMKQESK